MWRTLKLHNLKTNLPASVAGVDVCLEINLANGRKRHAKAGSITFHITNLTALPVLSKSAAAGHLFPILSNCLAKVMDAVLCMTLTNSYCLLL